MTFGFHQIELLESIAPYHADPTMIFNQLCGKRTSTLLLETAAINEKQNLKSMMVIDSALRISALGKIVILKAITINGAELLTLLDKVLPKEVKICSFKNGRKLIFPNIISMTDEDTHLQSLSIFDCLRLLTKIVIQPEQSSTAMFLAGLFSYDLVSYFESIPILTKGPKCPDYCFYLAETLLILDHQKYTCKLQSSLFTNNRSEKIRLQQRIKKLKKQLYQELQPIYSQKINNLTIKSNKNDEEYNKIIQYIKKSIYKGEIFQAVPSRQFFLPCPSPLATYQTLKKNNPSPYMFFMQDEIFTLFGASPESSLKYNANNRQIEIYPIAGTRPRGKHHDGTLNIDLDNRIECEMRSNHKELAEHFMLVDLARNDLARVCEPGSRYVADLIKVDRYSFVMHLVSRVVGKLRTNLDALHAYRACMNMGTLSGAPKIRAMQLIAEVEGERRGSYGGAIGYLTGNGSLDTCIVIRSAYIEQGIATVQAGAGIVLDSIPQIEAEESRNKALAVLHAIINTHSYRENI
ncbi:anthranilate synthase component 1 [Blochmannia endosymbiont of Camponotus (Colobopsis) obliquus]|uniref:anthranilate synthase component 1 n=1 Tax=Blochmannia endosymbiont of Camponotus (Colobopsis) obliquus TaxID=1505597 RepID=UPI00061A630C|nr:anthranilate synthase component 1 [Blochmannia endosymbiont of Camponotus (Colobopsis) obliquus]AKC60579.1 anthranilate synthase component I [Blochmannia endosymbiont of Camponotus (Colobopsis) obliquus]